MIIAVCGNIASGKTTLAKYICQNYKFTYIPNKRIEIDFLKDFFDDIPANFFQTQLSFLISKASQIKKLVAAGENIVIDRSLMEDINVFARLWIENYQIDERVKNLYLTTSEYIVSTLPFIDIYILCDCSPDVSKERLKIREPRDFEKKYPVDYIEKIYNYIKKLEYPDTASFVKISSEKWDFKKEEVLEKIVTEVFEKYNYQIEQQYHQISLFEIEEAKVINNNECYYIDKYIAGNGGNKINVEGLKRGKKIVYLAAPFTSIAMEENELEKNKFMQISPRKHGMLPSVYQKQLDKIRKRLVERWDVKVILPHKDINAWGKKELSSDDVLRKIVELVSQCDIVVAIPADSIGVHFEIGIAIAQNKPVLIFEVENMKNSFYVSNFDVLKGVWRYRVKTIDDIEYVLKNTKVLENIKNYMEEHEDEMD